MNLFYTPLYSCEGTLKGKQNKFFTQKFRKNILSSMGEIKKENYSLTYKKFLIWFSP